MLVKIIASLNEKIETKEKRNQIEAWMIQNNILFFNWNFSYFGSKPSKTNRAVQI